MCVLEVLFVVRCGLFVSGRLLFLPSALRLRRSAVCRFVGCVFLS